MKIKIMLTGNYLECDIVCIWNKIFYHSFILKDYISLQAPCQIFVSPLVRLRQLISHSHSHNIQSHAMHPTHNASLLSMIFTVVRLLYIILSYDDSHLVTELNEFERSKIRESRNVNISICWVKIRSARQRGRTVWANRWRDLWRRQRHHWLGRKASSIWVTRDRLSGIFRM
jgi:hypothetical protein